MPPTAGAPAPASLAERRMRRRLRDGDPGAIDAVYRQYQPRLLSYCRHMLGNMEEAEDAVQMTFLAAHVQLPYERIETSLGAWLFTVARRRCLDIIRRRGREEPLADREVSTAGLEDVVEGRAELRRLVADLQGLDDTRRSALLLTQLEALSQAEVARVMGTEESRVRRLVFEARQALLERRDARDLTCRAVQEELANARGSQLRRRHLVSHCDQCEECREFRTALIAQRTGLRSVLPVVPFLLLARRAWASSAVPRPRLTLPAHALTVLATVMSLAVIGGLPQPELRPTRATPVRPPAPARQAPARPASNPEPAHPARDQRTAAPPAAPATEPERIVEEPPAPAAAPPAPPAEAAPGAPAHPSPADPRPGPEPVVTLPPAPTVTVPAVTTPVPPAAIPEELPPPAVTVPDTPTVPEVPPAPPSDDDDDDDDGCTGDNNGNGKGEGCTPNDDPKDPPRGP